MGYGVMKISLQALGTVFHLPEDYRVISVQQDVSSDTLNIWFASESVPEQPINEYPLEIAPRYTVHFNPECPDQRYRKIACEVEIKHHLRLSDPDMLEVLRQK